MPTSILTHHMKRLFPFEFYDEISEQIVGYTLYNPVFLLDDLKELPTEIRKQLFTDLVNQPEIQAMHQNNILDIEPYGELLLLDNCCETKYVKRIINNEERSQIPMSMLVCQLYDRNNKPVFALDRPISFIAKLGEVLWDDPNLMLGVITLSDSDGPTIGVFKMPKRIEDQIFETVDVKIDEKLS